MDMSKSVDSKLSHSLSESASSVKTTNRVDDPIIVTVARTGAVASCIPSKLAGFTGQVTVGHRCYSVPGGLPHGTLTRPERSDPEQPHQTSGNRWDRTGASEWSIFDHSNDPIQ